MVFFYVFDVWPANSKLVRGERKKDLFKNMEKLPLVQSGHNVFWHASEMVVILIVVLVASALQCSWWRLIYSLMAIWRLIFDPVGCCCCCIQWLRYFILVVACVDTSGCCRFSLWWVVMSLLVVGDWYWVLLSMQILSCSWSRWWMLSMYLVLVGSTVPGDSHRQLIPATAHALLGCLPPDFNNIWPCGSRKLSVSHPKSKEACKKSLLSENIATPIPPYHGIRASNILFIFRNVIRDLLMKMPPSMAAKCLPHVLLPPIPPILRVASKD